MAERLSFKLPVVMKEDIRWNQNSVVGLMGYFMGILCLCTDTQKSRKQVCYDKLREWHVSIWKYR